MEILEFLKFFDASGKYYKVLGGIANLNANKATFRTMVNNPNNIYNLLGCVTMGK